MGHPIHHLFDGRSSRGGSAGRRPQQIRIMPWPWGKGKWGGGEGEESTENRGDNKNPAYNDPTGKETYWKLRFDGERRERYEEERRTKTTSTSGHRRGSASRCATIHTYIVRAERMPQHDHSLSPLTKKNVVIASQNFVSYTRCWDEG